MKENATSLFHTHCVTPGHDMPLPSCLALAAMLLFSSLSLFKSTLQLQLCTLPFPFPFTPFSCTSLLCPFFFFSSVHSKRMHYFQPWLCGVDRESRTMASFQSHSPGSGGVLAACIFFFSTVNSYRLMQQAYYWICLTITTDRWTKVKRSLFVFVDA